MTDWDKKTALAFLPPAAAHTGTRTHVRARNMDGNNTHFCSPIGDELYNFNMHSDPMK